MISTTGSTCSASSETTVSTSWSASSAAAAACCGSGSIERVELRIASRTADQNRCASCSSRSTDTTRPDERRSSAQPTRATARSSHSPAAPRRPSPAWSRRDPASGGGLPGRAGPGRQKRLLRSAAPGAPCAALSPSCSACRHARALRSGYALERSDRSPSCELRHTTPEYMICHRNVTADQIPRSQP